MIFLMIVVSTLDTVDIVDMFGLSQFKNQPVEFSLNLEKE